MSPTTRTRTVAMVGARGHTGAELLRLLSGHDCFELAVATSRELAGQRVRDVFESIETDIAFESLGPGEVADRGADIVILALPNGAAAPYVEAIDAATPDSIIIDLSADYRFTDEWVYGLPEHFRDSIRGAQRISNPGCYATGMQLALRPMIDLLSRPPVVFGVSGFSGAGTTPSDRNNPEKLRDNLMPYSLIGHTHEREVTRHLRQPVRFHPHVAPFFRGITLTISLEFREAQTAEAIGRRFEAYDDEPLVLVQGEIPLVRDIANRHECMIGGIEVTKDGGSGTVVATLDNLLKGAATQAVQNLNLACEIDEFHGILRATGC